MLKNNSLEFLRTSGGKWFLNVRYLLLSTPLIVSLSMLSAGSTQDSLKTSNEFLLFYSTVFVANIIAITLCAVWVILFSKTIFSKRDVTPVPLWAVAIFSMSVGALKGAGTGFVIWSFQIEPDLTASITSRVWQTTILGLWLVPALALVASRLELLQIQRDALVAEKVSRLLRDQESSGKEGAQVALQEFAKLARSRLIASTQENSFQPNRNYAEAIRKLVDDHLRPLSHRIWIQENKKFSNYSLTETARRAIIEFPRSSAVVGFMFALTSIPTLLRYSSLGEALLRGLVSGAAVYLTLRILTLFQSKKDWISVIWFFATTLFASAINFFSGEALFGPLAEFRSFESVFAIWLWLVQLGFICSFLLGVRRSRESLKSELIDVYGIEAINKAARFSQARIRNRDFANYLHGQVQNKLLAIALGLEKGTATKEELSGALSAVESVLESMGSEYELMNTSDLEAAMLRLKSQWLGFVDLGWQVDSSVHAAPERDRTLLIQVVEEALANSVRHGLAKNISVVMRNQGGHSTVEVTDDGLGPRDGKPGLGTSLFRNVSDGNWSLQQQPNGGSKLTVNF
jgi:two-component sensor histidine kinase